MHKSAIKIRAVNATSLFLTSLRGEADEHRVRIGLDEAISAPADAMDSVNVRDCFVALAFASLSRVLLAMTLEMGWGSSTTIYYYISIISSSPRFPCENIAPIMSLYVTAGLPIISSFASFEDWCNASSTNSIALAISW